MAYSKKQINALLETCESMTYGSNAKLDEIIDTGSNGAKKYLAIAGYGLDKLIDNEDPLIRVEVANHGYGLDILVNDKSFYVKEAVASQGYALDKFVGSNNANVLHGVVIGAIKTDRQDIIDIFLNNEKYKDYKYLNVMNELANAGYGKNKFSSSYYLDCYPRVGVTSAIYAANNGDMSLITKAINNSKCVYRNGNYYDIYGVREEIAEAGYELDLLSVDQHYCVRRAVAEVAIKYDRIDVLKKLAKDSNSSVSNTAKKQLASLVSEDIEIVKDFIYKVNDSSKITTQYDYDSLEQFFTADVDSIPIYIRIISIDTKTTIAKIERSNKGCKFIVDLFTETGDNFKIKSTIKTKNDLNKMVKSTIESLRNYTQFYKYADDLESAIY